MSWFDRVREEIFSGKVSDSDIQDRKAFDYLWNVYDCLHQLLFLEFGREFAGKITLWRNWLEFSYGWRSLEKGKRIASISHIPKYSLKIFSDGTFSISLNNVYNKEATKFFSKNIKEASVSGLFIQQVKSFLQDFSGAFLKIEDSKGERIYQLSELNENSLLKELSEIKPLEKTSLKGGYVEIWFSVTNEEMEIFSFISEVSYEFISLTKPFFMAFYFPILEVRPKRKVRNASERRNWERIKKELIQLEKRCQLCGTEKPLEVAHIVPFSHGGPDSPENLLVLCSNCHRKMVPTEPIGIKKSKDGYLIFYVEKDSREVKKELLLFTNHPLRENHYHQT